MRTRRALPPDDLAGTTAGASPQATARPLAVAIRGKVAAALPREPLLRNGHLLAVSSLVNTVLGACYWVLATHWYDARTVGLNFATVSAATLLSSIGQLNLSDFLVRFVPSTGRHTRKLVLTCYAAGTGCSVLAATVFLLLVPTVAPRLDFLLDPATAVFFVMYTAGYAVFVLQDGALTGVRNPGWVVTENFIFATMKIILLAVGAALALFTGILISWAGALVIALLVANFFLLRRALPRHERERPDMTRPPRLVGYAAADYVGSLFRMAAYSLVSLVVLNTLGAEYSAYFLIAWSVGCIPYMLVANMGSSLIVESAGNPRQLTEHAFRVLRHSALAMTFCSAAIFFVAPTLLSFFGPEYADQSTTLLRLLALSAIPNTLVSLAIDVARVRRRLRLVVGLQMALCTSVLGLSCVLLPELGLAGAGVAWLVAECLLACYLLIRRSDWLLGEVENPS